MEPVIGGPQSAPIRPRTITPDDALVDYLVDHGFGRAARRLAKSGTLTWRPPPFRASGTSSPGQVAQPERAHAADLISVDGPAAGHATTFLMSAQGLVDSSRAGPLHAQAADVVELLSDPARCQVVLVTLAEETPVNETVETALTLEDPGRLAPRPGGRQLPVPAARASRRRPPSCCRRRRCHPSAW